MINSKNIIFLHIPKTGGTTLSTIIEKHYHKSSIYIASEVGLGWCTLDDISCHFRNLTEKDKKKIKLLRGHQKFGLHDYLPNSFKYITMIREPISRVISHYFHLLRDDVPKQNKPNMPLIEYVKNGNSVCTNYQTRILSGISDFDYVDSKALDKAKFNLDNYFIAVGITQKFDQSLILFKNVFDWNFFDILYIKRGVAKNKKSSKISDDTLDIIKENNKLDIELYNFAQKKLQEINRKNKLFNFQLFVFKNLNKIYLRYNYIHDKFK